MFPNRTYDWPLWFDAARAGNPDAAVAFNDGSFCVGTTQPVTPLQDYLSGEVDLLIDGKIRLGGSPMPRYTCPSRGSRKARPANGTPWSPSTASGCTAAGPMPPPKYSDADLFRFVKSCKAVGGAVTLNVGIYQEGHMAPASVAQLGRLATTVSK